MDINRGHEVANRVQVLQRQVRSLLIHPESEELCLRIAKLCFRCSESDLILLADHQEASEVVKKDLQIIAVADPIVHLVAVAAALHLGRRSAIGSLGFGPAVLLSEGQRRRLNQAQRGPNGQRFSRSARG